MTEETTELLGLRRREVAAPELIAEKLEPKKILTFNSETWTPERIDELIKLLKEKK